METFILSLLFSLVSANALLTTDHEDVTNLTNCVVKMLENVDYKRYFHIMDITLMNIKNDLKLSALHNVRDARFVSRRFYWETNDLTNVFYVVVSENFQELEHGLKKVISDTYWNPSANFIIVLKSYKNHSLHDITVLLRTYNIFFASLISRKGGEYAIYRYNFTTPGHCFKSGRLTFWSWCSDYCSEKQLPFLTKGSIRNCRYKFISRNLWPFTNFDSNLKGIEQYFVSLFEKHYGVTIDLQAFGKIDKYEQILDNTRMIMLNKVENNEVEGAIGGYSITEQYSGNVSHSYPIAIDHMFYILAHAKYIGPWIAVLKGSTTTCVLIVLLFVIFCIAATLLSIFPTRKDVSHNVLMVFGYLLNKYAVSRINAGWPQAIVFSSLLFTSFIIPYAIQANLYSVTTEPVRGYEPKTSEELKNYQAVLYNDFQYRNNQDFLGYTECATRIKCLMQVKNCENRSLYTVVTSAHYLANLWRLTDSQCNFATYGLREPYITVLRTIYLRRGSVLFHPMKQFYLRVANTGIVVNYARNLYIREWRKCKSHYRSEHVPLSMSNIYYVFMILIGGYCLSGITFIYELLVGSQILIQRRA